MHSAAIEVRDVCDADMPAITAIYEHHVRVGSASFEETPPDEAEMRARRDVLLHGSFPYVVAVCGGVVAGYAYAGPYRARPAYRNTVENSVYVAPESAGKGIGRALLQMIIDQSTVCGFRQMIAVIGDSANDASIILHQRLGFEHVGTMRSVGFKHGGWLDSVIMQRPLGESDDTLP